MKSAYLLLSLLLFISCKQSTEPINPDTSQSSSKEITVPYFQQSLDTQNLKGNILIYDLKNSNYYSNDFDSSLEGHLPASTFKIPNSIIALETGIINNDSSILKWNGEDRRLAIWEQDLFFKDAFQYSCVPCYQEIARNIGIENMKKYIHKLDYGSIEVDTSSLDMFWLVGESKITPSEQIDFLKRLYLSELNISSRTDEIIKRMLIIEYRPGYTLSGKTGWSIQNEINNGWFVGYLELKDQVYFFSTNIEPLEAFNMGDFPAIRKKITLDALAFLFM